MGIDDEAQALFKQWQAQQKVLSGGQSNLVGDMDVGTDQSPHLFEQGTLPTSPDQSPTNPVNSVRPMGAPISKAPPMDPNLAASPNMGNLTNVQSPGSTPQPAQMPDVCKECGTMHPPLAAGQKCPNASVAATPNDPNAIDDATINKHLVDMRNIIMTQIGSKGIKDQKKFFQFAVIELTKALEGYNE